MNRSDRFQALMQKIDIDKVNSKLQTIKRTCLSLLIKKISFAFKGKKGFILIPKMYKLGI